MVVSGEFCGEIRREKLKLLLGKTETLARTFKNRGLEPDYVKNLNATWLNFRQPIAPEYDGDAEKIYEWLLYGAEEISKLKPN